MSDNPFAGTVGAALALAFFFVAFVLIVLTIMIPLFIHGIHGRVGRMTEQLNSIGKLLQELIDIQRPKTAPIRLPETRPSELIPTIRVAQYGKDLGELPIDTIRDYLRTGRMTEADQYLSSSNEWRPLSECSHIKA